MADDGGMMAKTRLSQNPFAIKTATPTRSLADSTEGKDSRPLLAPPTLKWGNDCGVSSSSPKIFLRPSALAAQAEKLAVSNQGGSSKPDGEEKSSLENKKDDNENSSESTPINTFLGGSSRDSDTSASSAGFVFGQNLHERVFGALDETKEEVPESTVPDLSFEAAASKKEAEQQQRNGEVQHDEVAGSSSESGPSPTSSRLGAQVGAASSNKSLTESAEEYQSKQVKRKFSEVTVVTGEEDESNVLQMNCKLFTFDKVSSAWQERGRGFLRLNDREVDGSLQSRLVMRTQGSLRVVMNTKVWVGMTVDHPSQKTVRITAMEPEGVKVFLIMASSKDTEQLFSALDWRITMLKSQEERSNTGESSDFSSLQASSSTSAQGTSSGTDAFSISLPPSTSNDDDYQLSAKRWRSTDSSDNHNESNAASRSISSVEDDLSSDSGFPATEDS